MGGYRDQRGMKGLVHKKQNEGINRRCGRIEGRWAGDQDHIPFLTSVDIILDWSLRRKIACQEEHLESSKASGMTGIQVWFLVRNVDAWAFGTLTGALPTKITQEGEPHFSHA